MKKTFKRAGIAVLSMSMLLSIGAMTAISTSATTTAGTTQVEMAASKDVTMPSKTGIYKIYKIASATYDTGAKAYRYTSVDNFSSILEIDNTTGLLKVKADATGIDSIKGKEVHSLSASEAMVLAKKLESESGTQFGSDLSASGTQTFSTTDAGYYLIKASTSGITDPILLPVTDSTALSLNAKNSEITFTKEITAIDTAHGTDNVIGTDGSGNAGGSGIVDAGATVTYQLSTNFPSYSDSVTTATNITDFVIVDIPDNNLTIQNSTIKVKVDGSEVSSGTDTYSINDSYTDSTINEGTGFKIEFKDPYVITNKTKLVTVEFNAIVSNTPNTGRTPNLNESKLTYGNDFTTGGGEANLTDDAKVYCTVFTANKIAPNNAVLTGAKFKLVEGNSASGTTIGTIQGTGSESTFTWSALAEGTYTLVETEAPNGYKLADPVTFTISAGKVVSSNEYNGTFTFMNGSTEITNGVLDVVDYPGQILPGTGGMGTVLFTVGGAAVVLLAGVLFVVYMRKRKVEE